VIHRRFFQHRGRFSDIVGDLIGIFTNLFAAFLVIPFATFFFLKDGYKIRRDMLQLVPNKYFESILTLLDKIETRLGRYFRSVALQCTLVGIASWICPLGGRDSTTPPRWVSPSVWPTRSPILVPMIGYVLSIIIAIT
jgi:predicted PurR-regulated permease PerM